MKLSVPGESAAAVRSRMTTDETTSEESSYNIRLISMEDSQIDPYLLDSPYVLNWNLMNRGGRYRRESMSRTNLADKMNLSEVEVKRGESSSASASVSSDSSAIHQYKIESISEVEVSPSTTLTDTAKVPGRIEASSETFVVPAAAANRSLLPEQVRQSADSTCLSSSSSSSFSVSSASFSISSSSSSTDKTVSSGREEKEREERERAKLKRVLKLQKLQQEVRLKALEELARLERLQSKEMRDIYDASSVFSNSSLSGGSGGDSFFQAGGHSGKLTKAGSALTGQSADSFYTSASLSSTCSSDQVGRDQFRESFMSELFVKNLLVKQQRAKQKSSKENRPPGGQVKVLGQVDMGNKTRVEVFNPKDTTVLEQPKSVRIIRENNATAAAKKQHLSTCGAKIPSNLAKSCYFEVAAQKECKPAEKPRASSSTPGGGGGGGGGQSTASMSSHLSMLSQVNEELHDDSAGKPGLSYFNSSGNQSVRLQQQNNDDWLDSLHEFEPPPPPRPSARCEPKRTVDWTASKPLTSKKAAPVPPAEKPSLQAAFEARQASFIRRSQRRQHEIQVRAQERRLADQLRQELQIETMRREGERKMRESAMRSLESEKLCPRRQRPMTWQEIRETTRKNYERLPEVKQRLVQQKLEQERLQNRLKYSIYAKTIQQRLLTNGPNFRLDFKALAD